MIRHTLAGITLLLLLPGILAPVRGASAQTPAALSSDAAKVNALPDGRHDFDFKLGSWRSHIRRLQHPLTGSGTWTELEGTVTVRPVWNGRALLEEVEAQGTSGKFEGLTLFLYNPDSRQWSMNFANSSSGTLGQPTIGAFRNGRGEFFDQEIFNGRSILVRIVWSDITATSHRFEQSFSDDGGRTWEPNFVATVVRDSAARQP